MSASVFSFLRVVFYGCVVVLCAGGGSVGDTDRIRASNIDTALAVMRSIETSATGLETRFRFSMENRDPAGDGVLRYETDATWWVDRGRVAGQERQVSVDNNTKVNRWWTGTEFATLPMAADTLDPQGALHVSWYFHANLPVFAAMFNHCVGYHQDARTGLPMALRLADNINLETDDDAMVVRYGVGENRRYTLAIDLLPSPRYRSWVMEMRRRGSQQWFQYARYAVDEWMTVGGLELPRRATCRYRVPQPDGSILDAEHVFERIDAQIVDDRTTVESWFDIPYVAGTRVVNTTSGVQWTVGDTTLIVDDVGYEVAEPIWTDPTPRIAELLARVGEGVDER